MLICIAWLAPVTWIQSLYTEVNKFYERFAANELSLNIYNMCKKNWMTGLSYYWSLWTMNGKSSSYAPVFFFCIMSVPLFVNRFLSEPSVFDPTRWNRISMTTMPSREPITFERPSCSYQNLSSRFEIKDGTFQRQYAHMYCERLLTMRKRLEESARKKWGKFGKFVPE